MRLYSISFVPSNDCFFHLNKRNLSHLLEDGVEFSSHCLQVRYGENFDRSTYSCVSGVPSKVLQDDTVGISPHFAAVLGLDEGDEVMMTKSVAASLSCVYVSPKDSAAFELVMTHRTNIENRLLSQVRVVVVGQVLPIHLYSNIYVLLKVEKLEPNQSHGQIQQCVELIVLTDSGTFVTDHQQTDSESETIVQSSDLTKENAAGLCMKFFDLMFKYWNNLKLEKSLSSDKQKNIIKNPFSVLSGQWRKDESQSQHGVHADASYLSPDDMYLKSVCERNRDTCHLYTIGALFTIKNQVADTDMSMYAYARNFPSRSPVHDDQHKVFCKISRVEGVSNDVKFLNDIQGISSSLYTYILNLDDDKLQEKYVYCPEYVMEILKLSVGSKVIIEEVAPSPKLESSVEKLYNSAMLLRKTMKTSDEMVVNKCIYDNVISTISDNVKTKQIVNTLIIGGVGTGKTYLLDRLYEYFRDAFFHVARVDWKKLRKMKVESVSKSIEEKMTKCHKFEHSLLLFDDLDSFMIGDEEENMYATMYTDGIARVLLSLLSDRSRGVSVVATCVSLSNLRAISTDRGPIVFESIHEILELNTKDRFRVLKSLVTRKDPSFADEELLDVAAERTKGYKIQDLADLVQMAAVNSMLRNGSCVRFERKDLESALAEKVPLSLSEVNLKKNWTIKWDDVGGMEETKRLLTEMFAWPFRYPEIYKSCPLRQQCGVLLYGAPGTGKTLIAGAVANECGLNFISIKGPEVFSKYVGGSEEGIRKLFAGARQAKPCILFFDEFDSLAPRRGSTNGEVNDRVVNQMLTELDGVEELTGVFVLAATSRPDILDPALLRPGRIDKAVHCSPPNKEERLSILKALSKNVRLSEDVDLRSIADETDGYTGADLQGVLYAAQTALVKEMEGSLSGQTTLTLCQRHVEAGLSVTKPSISREDWIKYETIYGVFTSSRTGRSPVSGTGLQQQRVTYA